MTVKLEGKPFPYLGGMFRKGPKELSDVICDAVKRGSTTRDLVAGPVNWTTEEIIDITNSQRYSISVVATLTLGSPKPDLDQILVDRTRTAADLAALDEQRVAAVAAENESYYRRKGALQRERDAKLASITQEFDQRRAELTRELAKLDARVAEIKGSSEPLAAQDLPKSA